jgi:hypothetical protein
MKENSIEYCDFFQFTIFVGGGGGGSCDYSLRGSKNPATLLHTRPDTDSSVTKQEWQASIHILPFNNKTTQILDTMTTVILL